MKESILTPWSIWFLSLIFIFTVFIIIIHAKKFQKKKITYASLTTLKLLTVWITANYGKFLKRWEYQNTLPASWEICMQQVNKQQLELDMEQQTGPNLRTEYIKVMYCHTAYLTYLQSASCKMLGWMKHKLKSRLPGEISIISDMQRTPPLWKKAKRN